MLYKMILQLVHYYITKLYHKTNYFCRFYDNKCVEASYPEETALIVANAQHMIQEIGLNADKQLNEMGSHSEIVRLLSKQATKLQKAV